MIATIALVSGLRSRLCVNNNDLPTASGLVWAASRHSVFVFIHRNYKMLNDVFCLTFMTSSSPVDSRWLQGLWVSLEMILLTSRKKSELPHGSPDKIYQVTGEKWADINNVMGRGLFFHCFFAWPRFLVFIIPGQSGPITRKTRISTILVLVQILSDLASLLLLQANWCHALSSQPEKIPGSPFLREMWISWKRNTKYLPQSKSDHLSLLLTWQQASAISILDWNFPSKWTSIAQMFIQFYNNGNGGQVEVNCNKEPNV